MKTAAHCFTAAACALEICNGKFITPAPARQSRAGAKGSPAHSLNLHVRFAAPTIKVAVVVNAASANYPPGTGSGLEGL